jgi:hypothetical protein
MTEDSIVSCWSTATRQAGDIRLVLPQRLGQDFLMEGERTPCYSRDPGIHRLEQEDMFVLRLPGRNLWLD